MVWFSEDFFYLQANDKPYGDSVKLSIDDGWSIMIEMDECETGPICNCEEELKKDCPNSWQGRRLTKSELISLRDACNEALKYLEEDHTIKWDKK